jgi:hypothetical protein
MGSDQIYLARLKKTAIYDAFKLRIVASRDTNNVPCKHRPGAVIAIPLS